MPGKFEQAHGGTLLLDEISEMEIGLQAKILRVLQEREVERLGGRRIIKLDVRILATTNRDLISYVTEKKFREDLYYRLSVFPLHWKSLRQRQQDIMPIAERLLHKHCKKQGKPQLIFEQSAQHKLITHAWPGNVRELDNVIQRALIIQTGMQICAGDIVLDMMQGQATQAPLTMNPVAVSPIDSSAAVLSENILSPAAPSPLPAESERYGSTPEPVMPQATWSEADDVLGDNLKQREYSLILDALKHEKNKKLAAQKLGISPRTLRYKMAKMRDQGIELNGNLMDF